MKAIFRAGVAASMMCAMIGQSWAAGICTSPEEARALKTAALQQKLMVAALYCDDVGFYNRFVISFQKELQDSDAVLLGYFQRANVASGTADYHAFKTALANNFSVSSVRHMGYYCSKASVAFDEALNPDNRTLASFVSAQYIPETDGYDTCGERIAGGEAVAGASSQIAARVADGAGN
jgi:hypothetical protein